MTNKHFNIKFIFACVFAYKQEYCKYQINSHMMTIIKPDTTLTSSQKVYEVKLFTGL